MKKYLISPLFTPVFFTLIWLLWMCCIFVFKYNCLPDLLNETGPIEQITNLAYIPLFLAYILFAKMFWEKGRDARIDFILFVFLGMAAFLREMGIQHWLASKDTTAFKSRFFLNSENPLSEKIIAGFLLLLLVAVLIYLGAKYARRLISSFFRMNPITWSIATLCTFGVFAKFVDRFPSNYKKSHGFSLPEQLRLNLEIVEETSEIMLPLIAMFIFVQYWLLRGNKPN